MIINEDKIQISSPSQTSPSPYESTPPYITGGFAAPPSNNAPTHSDLGLLQLPTHWGSSSSSASASSTFLPSPPSSPPHTLARSQSHPILGQPPIRMISEPPSLSRIPPPNLPRIHFPPMFLLAQGNSLKRGFPCIIPPDDWTRFLDDLRDAATLSEKDKMTAYCVPILSAVPIINVAVATVMKQHIRSKKPRFVGLLVDKWNHHFFHPRRLEAILMMGQNKLSGQSERPIAGLYTPPSVNFTFPVFDKDTPDSPDATSQSTSLNKSKTQDKDRDRDKTYRLFLVSMEG
ncbi:hypothetical protein B0H10DRAFT_1998380 [Mycena sp. CBHHK59/15]|nr:hypothetical protein B0H10DRAFT_1998380 [Mycena sp. CBHHK59/15]